MFGLFVVISRRKVSERNQTLRSFVDENNPISREESAINPQNKSNINASDDDKIFTDDLNKKNEQGSVNSKKNYLPIADDD